VFLADGFAARLEWIWKRRGNVARGANRGLGLNFYGFRLKYSKIDT